MTVGIVENELYCRGMIMYKPAHAHAHAHTHTHTHTHTHYTMHTIQCTMKDRLKCIMSVLS